MLIHECIWHCATGGNSHLHVTEWINITLHGREYWRIGYVVSFINEGDFIFANEIHWSLYYSWIDLFWQQISVITGTTRLPAFWDSHPLPPPCPMITHISDSHQIPSQNKTKSKLQIYKNFQKYKFWNFAKNFTRNTPSEVAWWDV